MSATSAETALKLADQSFLKGDIDTAILYALSPAHPHDPVSRWPANCNYIMAYHIHRGFSLFKNWYRVLNIHDHSVDTITIKKAYKTMARRVHPDKNSSVAAETAFQIITEAVEVLSDPYKRKAHDLELQSKKRTVPSSGFTDPISSWLRSFDDTQEPVVEPPSKKRRIVLVKKIG